MKILSSKNPVEVLDPAIEVRIVKNPFAPEAYVKDYLDYDPEKKLGDYLVDLPSPEKWTVAVDGIAVEREQWDRFEVSPSQTLILVLTPEGGDDGKAILRIVAQIAVAVAAFYFGGMLGGWQAAAAMVAINVAGNLLVNALIPPPAPDISDTSIDTASPSYSLQGAKNTSREGIPVPVVYGDFRVAGNIVDFYTENVNDEQWFAMRIVYNDGEIEGFSDITVNDQPIDDFEAMDYITTTGAEDGSPSNDWFNSAIRVANRGIQLDTGWSTYTTSDEVDQVRVDLVMQGLAKFKKNGDKETHSVTVDVEYRRLGDTTWQSLPVDQAVTFNAAHQTPANTRRIDLQVSPTWSEDASRQSTVTASVSAEYRLVGDTEWTSFPQGTVIRSQRNFDTGSLAGSIANAAYYSDNENYDDYQNNTTVSFGVNVQPGVYEVRANGGTITYATVRAESTYAPGSFTYSGATLDTLRRSIRSAVLPFDRYQIRVRRTTAESTETDVVDRTFWSDIAEITLDNSLMNGTATLSVRGKATDQITSRPTIAAMIGGSKANIYDVDGNVVAYEKSKNPYFIALDILTNPYRGAGMSLDRFEIDSFVEAAEIAEENGWEFNGVFDSEMSIFDAVGAVLRVGRGQLIQTGTKWSVTVEKPETPVTVFNDTNIIKGTMSTSWLPMEDRANEIRVSYADASDSYKMKTIRVVDQDIGVSGETARVSTFEDMGVTNVDQAYENAIYQLRRNRLLRKTIQFEASTEAIALGIGDVAYVSTLEADYARNGQNGKFTTGSNRSTINLDRDVTIEAGNTYSLLAYCEAYHRATLSVNAVSTGENRFRFNNNGDPSGFTDVGLNDVDRVRVNGKDYEVDRYGTWYSNGAWSNENRYDADATIGWIYLKEDIDFVAGDTVEFWSTRLIEERQVTTSPGSTSVVTVSPALSFEPQQYGNWIFGRAEVVKRPFRLLSFSGDDVDRRQLSWIEYSDDLFLPVDESLPPPVVIEPNLPIHVTDVSADFDPFPTGYADKRFVTISWNIPDLMKHGGADIHVNRDGKGWRLEKSVLNVSSADLEAVNGETLEVQVVAFDKAGRRAPKNTAPSVSILTEYAPRELEAPASLSVTRQGFDVTGSVILSWVRSNEDVEQYRVEYAAISQSDYDAIQAGTKEPAPTDSWTEIEIADWNDGFVPAAIAQSNSALVQNLAVGYYQYRVRAERSGSVSPWLVETYELVQPTFVSSITGLSLDEGGTTFSGQDVKVSWNDIFEDQDGNATQDNWPFIFRDYLITVLDTEDNVIRTETRQEARFVYSYEKNLEDSKSLSVNARRALKISVQARGKQGQLSTVATIQVSNPVPAALPAAEVTPVIGGCEVVLSSSSDSDFLGYRVWTKDTDNISSGNTSFIVSQNRLTIPLTGETKYLRYAAFDSFDSDPANLQMSPSVQIQDRQIVADDVTFDDILQDQLDTLDQSLQSADQAIQDVDARVDAADQAIATVDTQIRAELSNVEQTLIDADAALAANIDTVDQALAAAQSTLNNTISQNKSDIESALQTAEDRLDAVDTSQNARIDTVEGTINDPTTGLSARATNTQLQNVETTLQSSISTTASDIRSEFAAGDSVVDARVTDLTDAVASNRSADLLRIGQLETDVNDPTSGLDSKASSTDLTQVRTDLEDASASETSRLEASIIRASQSGENALTNGNFALWGENEPLPAGGIAWPSGANVSNISRVQDGEDQIAARISVGASEEAGINFRTYVKGGSPSIYGMTSVERGPYFYVEFEYRIAAGSNAGAGLFISVRDDDLTSHGAASIKIAEEHPTVEINKWRTIRKVVKVGTQPRNEVILYFMANYNSAGWLPLSAKTIDCRNLYFRTATDEEIAGLELGGLQSAIEARATQTQLANTEVSLLSADASLASDLRSEFNAADSAVDARITSVEQTRVTERAADVARTASLEASRQRPGAQALNYNADMMDGVEGWYYWGTGSSGLYDLETRTHQSHADARQFELHESPEGRGIRYRSAVEGNTSAWGYGETAFPVDISRRYFYRLRVLVSDPGTVSSSVYGGIVTLDENFSFISGGAGAHRYISPAVASHLVSAGDIITIEGIYEGVGDAATQFRAGTKYIRPMFILNYSAGDSDCTVLECSVTDAEAVEVAKDAATAAITASANAQATINSATASSVSELTSTVNNLSADVSELNIADFTPTMQGWTNSVNGDPATRPNAVNWTFQNGVARLDMNLRSSFQWLVQKHPKKIIPGRTYRFSTQYRIVGPVSTNVNPGNDLQFGFYSLDGSFTNAQYNQGAANYVGDDSWQNLLLEHTFDSSREWFRAGLYKRNAIEANGSGAYIDVAPIVVEDITEAKFVESTATNLESRISTVETDYASSTSLSVLDSRIGSAESTLTNLQNTQTNDNNARVSDISSLQTQIAANDSELGSVTSLANNVNSRLTIVENDYALASEVSQLEAQLNTASRGYPLADPQLSSNFINSLDGWTPRGGSTATAQDDHVLLDGTGQTLTYIENSKISSFSKAGITTLILDCELVSGTNVQPRFWFMEGSQHGYVQESPAVVLSAGQRTTVYFDLSASAEWTDLSNGSVTRYGAQFTSSSGCVIKIYSQTLLGSDASAISSKASAIESRLATVETDKASAQSVTDLSSEVSGLTPSLLRGSSLGMTPNGDFTEGPEGYTNGRYTDALTRSIEEFLGYTWLAEYEGRQGVIEVQAGFFGQIFGAPTPIDPSRKYRVVCSIRTETGTARYYAGLAAFNSSYGALSHNPGSYAYSTLVNYYQDAASGWEDFEGNVVTSEGTGTYTIFPVGTAYAQPMILMNYLSNSSGRTWIDKLYIEDVTDLENDRSLINSKASISELQSTETDLENAIASLGTAVRSEFAAEDATLNTAINDLATLTATNRSADLVRISQLETDVSDAENEIATKASQTDLDALSSTVDGKASATSVEALEATSVAANNSPENIVTNGNFAIWGDGQLYPSGGRRYTPASDNQVSRVEDSGGDGSRAIRFVTDGVSASGMMMTTYSKVGDPALYGLKSFLRDPHHYIEFEFKIVSGGLNGAGVLLNVRNDDLSSHSSHSIQLVNEYPSGVTSGEWYKVRKVVKIGSSPKLHGIIYLMSDYATYGGLSAKTIEFRNIYYREATDEEIAGYELGGLQQAVEARATQTQLQAAETTLNSAISSLEASLRSEFTAGDSAVDARVTELTNTTATNRAADLAVISSMQGSVSTLSGNLSSVQSSVSAIDGRLGSVEADYASITALTELSAKYDSGNNYRDNGSQAFNNPDLWGASVASVSFGNRPAVPANEIVDQSGGTAWTWSNSSNYVAFRDPIKVTPGDTYEFNYTHQIVANASSGTQRGLLAAYRYDKDRNYILSAILVYGTERNAADGVKTEKATYTVPSDTEYLWVYWYPNQGSGSGDATHALYGVSWENVSQANAAQQTADTAEANAQSALTAIADETSARVSDVVSINAAIGTNTAAISTVNSVAVDAQDKANAITGTQAEVNGRKGGFVLGNNGDVVGFRVTADVVEFADPDDATNTVSPIRFNNGVAELKEALIRSLQVLPSAGATIWHGVQLAPREYVAQDGDTITFDGSYENTGYRAEIDTSGLPALASGESYDIRLVNKALGSADLRVKKVTAGALVPQSSVNPWNSTSGQTPQYTLPKNADDDRADQYTFQFAVNLPRTFYEVVNDGGITFHNATFSGTVGIYGRTSAGWSLIKTETFSVDYYGSTDPGTIRRADRTVFVEIENMGDLSGDQFGLHPSSGAVIITNQGQVTWNTQSQTSETSVAGNLNVRIFAP